MAETALLVATLAAGAGAIYSGVSSNAAAQENAKLQEEQARIAQSEAEQAATQKGTERRRFLAQQRMAYLASGVTLSGTPGIVESETYKEFQMEIDAFRRSGAAQYGLGMKQATNTRASGRAQLVSGILSGVGAFGMGGYKLATLK